MTILPTSTVFPATRVAGEDGQTSGAAEHPVLDPATGSEIARIGWADSTAVQAAVTTAAATQPDWSATSVSARSDALRAIAAELRQAVDRLAPLITAESGKRIAEARAEVMFSAAYFDWFAEAAGQLAVGEQRVHPDRRFLVNRQPVGVVAALTPWNFPLSIPARKIAPTLAAGCTVVLKPSELTPLSAYELVRICEPHLPSGAVGLVVGDGEEVSNALLDHADVAAVTFTGSTGVGRLVGSRAAETFTRCTLELGGKAPFIVCADAEVASAVDTLMVAKFRNNGASCLAANNVFIHTALYDEVVAALVERVERLRVGDPADEATDLGPLLRKQHVDRLQAQVEAARAGGARIRTGGPVPTEGFYLAPSVVELSADGPLWDEEIFGPVCVVRPFEDESAVVSEVNSWRSGLGGYVVSADTEHAVGLAERLRIGIVGVNVGAPNTPEVPFGGFGSSGIGREGGLSGLYEFTEEQTVSIARQGAR